MLTYPRYLHILKLLGAIAVPPRQAAVSILQVDQQPFAQLHQLFLLLILKVKQHVCNHLYWWFKQINPTIHELMSHRQPFCHTCCQSLDRKARGERWGRILLCCHARIIFGVLWNSTAAWAVREREWMEEVWERRKLVKGRKGSHKTLFPPSDWIPTLS